MYYSTNHTIYLQDGTLFSFKRRFKKHSQLLIQSFSKVIDGRSKFGKRHPLPFILIILFGGITAGNTTVKDCRLWALHSRKWLQRVLSLDSIPHGIPDERTISRALAKIDIDSLVTSYLFWRDLLYGLDPSLVASFDGKSMNGIHGKDSISHILSLFSHNTHQILGQIGVSHKENEIPAFRRLLIEQQPFILGMLLIGDALHTQKETAKLILDAHAHYLLFAKGNQEMLASELETFFSKLPFQTTTDTVTDQDVEKGRDIITTVTTSQDSLMTQYLIENGWEGVQTIGVLHRAGTRTQIDQRTNKRVVNKIDETVYFISSQKLSAQQASSLTRNHWCIENNLHWTKDYLFLEDRCTLRAGNAPQVMTFLRSCCLSLFDLFKFNSPTQTCSNFEKNATYHHSFLRMAGVL